MKKYFVLILFVLLFVHYSKGQSTGFMGKRVMLGYSFNTSPAFFGSSANNESILGDGGSAATGEFVVNAIHEGFIEIAPSSKWEIGFSCRYYKTTYDNAKNFNTLYGGSQYYFNSDTRPSGYYNIRGLSYTLYFRYFGSRYIAPWGRYMMFGPVLNTMKTTYDPYIMHVSAYDNSGFISQQVTLRDFGPIEQDYKGVNLMIGAGRSRLIANRVSLDYGFNTHLLSLLSGFYEILGMDFNRDNTTNTNYISKTVRSRVRGVNRFNVFIKVGILLF